MDSDSPSKPETRRAPALGAGAEATSRRFSSDDLFSGAREIVIEHAGRTYQLRITQNGKLILTA